jgi:signal peptidase II
VPRAEGAAAAPSRTRAWTRLALAAAAVVALDQGTKALVVASIERGEEVRFFIGVDLTHVRNTGVAFGAFEGAGTLVAAISALALVGLLVYFGLNATRRALWLPVAAVLGGAVGNLVDRARLGAVVDFVDPIAWPAFNVADVAIVLGILGVFYVVEGERER